MATKKPRTPARKKQADPVFDLGNQIIAQARHRRVQLEASYKATKKSNQARRRELLKELSKAKTAELRAETVQLQQLGLYSPILSGPEFTRGQKQTIRRKYRLAQELSKYGAFAPYPKSISKSEKSRLITMTRKRGGQATKKGIFLLRNEKELKTLKGKLKYEKDTGLYKMVVTKRFKNKEGRIVIRTEQRYLDGESAMIAVEAKIRKRIEKIKLRPGERLRFAIGGPDGNLSHSSFANFEQLMRYTEHYRNTPEGLASFRASLTIYTVREGRGGRYNVPGRSVDIHGRQQATPGPDILAHFLKPRAGKAKRTPRKGAAIRAKNKG